MKEIVFNKIGSEEVLEVIEAEIPKAGEGEVVVKSSAIGVNPVEILISAGLYSAGPGVFPHRLGTDAAGIVHEVGPGVTSFKVGDPVWVYFRGYNGSGTYAEYFKCPSGRAHHLPKNIDMRGAAGLGIPFLTAHQGLHMANARPGETLLVNGASGAVGRAAVQMGKMIGMTVIGTAGSDEGLQLVKKLGAHHALNYKDKDLGQKIKELTNGNGVDVVLEPVGDANVAFDAEIAAVGGRIVVFGFKGPMASFSGMEMLKKQLQILGLGLFGCSETLLRQSVAYVNAGMQSGSLTPTFGTEFPLSDVRKAFAVLKSGKAKGKIVLIP